MEAARTAARTRDTYLSAQYHRLPARRGTNRAALVIGQTILVIVSHILRNGTTYQDLGANHFHERAKAAVIRKAIRRIERLGYKVTVEPNAA